MPFLLKSSTATALAVAFVAGLWTFAGDGGQQKPAVVSRAPRAPVTTGQCIDHPFGAAASLFNGFTLGDFHGVGSGLVEGRLAAGGSLTLDSYSVGKELPAVTADCSRTSAAMYANTIVAGGIITLPAGEFYNGHVVAGSSAKVTAKRSPSTCKVKTFLPSIDFEAAAHSLETLAAELASLSATGAIVESPADPAALHLTLSGKAVEVVECNAGMLVRAASIAVSPQSPKPPSSATLIINVVGADTVNVPALQAHWPFAQRKVIWNFVDATLLNLPHGLPPGSILALKAAVEGAGSVVGQLFAASYKGSIDFQIAPFDGCLPKVVPKTQSGQPPSSATTSL
ncbi:hypothetical protein BDK51DRAFT_29756 [Blyttiomyces helicus]|uniref:Choice-of-anchor A domain-containing protein n=1 Tax=Blyttiomyces helicus TaxID=388810 RepID=A0A4P9WKC3_9FUNG|nr:hypothetical protein BDK51DRAFT_29756 [Blyttiomyces helicus]|eukprot:RKO92453.1 hypothetical protein BDK51DRAFT_29756 [Blyttiomyces helicus]